jgi:membrane associated rhomboid family serine protease
VALIAACAAVFLYEVTLPARALDLFIRTWGATPRLILPALAGNPAVPRGVLLTLFTSQFIHGGWLHLAGNLLFLWVFGRAVEDRLGRFPYLAVYLLGGAAAAVAQCWVTGTRGAESIAPLIGASGAIATILGVYFVSFPTAWVRVLVPLFLFFFWQFDVPAVLMLALWFFGQFFLGASMTSAAGGGPIAIWAHIAGFIAGMLFGALWPAPAVRPAAGAGAIAIRRGAPGPVGLVGSLASLCSLLLVARVALRLLAARGGPSLLGQAVGLDYAVTDLIVRPVAQFVPVLRIEGHLLDVPAIAALIAIYLLAAAVTYVLSAPTGNRVSRLPAAA